MANNIENRAEFQIDLTNDLVSNTQSWAKTFAVTGKDVPQEAIASRLLKVARTKTADRLKVKNLEEFLKTLETEKFQFPKEKAEEVKEKVEKKKEEKKVEAKIANSPPEKKTKKEKK